jgi:tetratricopeptide (TPR) repeat protein
MLSAILVGVALWRPWLPEWERSFEQGQLLEESNSQEAERLLQKSINEAGGRFGNAQLAICGLRGRQNRWKEAADLLADVNLKDCQSRFLYRLGRDACASQQWTVAQPVLAELLHRDFSEKREVLSLLKVIYSQLGQFREMRECAEELTRLVPDDPMVWWDLAQTSEKMGHTTEAIAAYRTVLKNDVPLDASIQVFQKLLDLLVESGDINAARSELNLFISLHGRQPECSLVEAELFRLEGRSQEALKSIEQYFADGGQSLRALMIRGLLKLELGDAEQALKDFEEVAQRDPSYESAQFKLAETYRHLGRFEPARRHQAEYERIQKIRFETEELKKLKRSRLPSDANREGLPALQD